MNYLSKLIDHTRTFLMNCRLCWHVGLVVLASIVTIEAIILIPSYRNYERDMLRRLEREGLATAKSLFLMGDHTNENELRMMVDRMLQGSVVSGLFVSRPDSGFLAASNVTPALLAIASGNADVDGERTEDGNGYIVRWSEPALGAPFIVTARLDSSWIAEELRAFVVRIIGLVLLISTFVTAATMGILGRSVLIPVLRLRQNLMAAANDSEHPDRYTIAVDRKDELGDVMVAFNRMIHDVASTHRREIRRVVAMSENSIAAVVAYDADGELIYHNKALLKLSGANIADVPGRNGFPRVVSEAHDPIPLAEYLAREAATQEVVLEMAPGRPVPCLLGGNHLRDENGDLSLYYASILEVSEMHVYRERLEAKNMELGAANRAKSEFLAHMSHELRTPLNAILGFSEIMELETLGPLGSARYREYAHDIHESGSLLLSIISDILDLSKIEAGKTELSEQDIDVSEAMAACLRIVKERAGIAGVTIETQRPDSLPALRADQRLLKQIVLNLLTNSIKFTPSGGQVTVRAEITPAGELAIAVADNGPGIAEEDISTALAPFGQVGVSLTAKHDGTGLGLPLVQSFANLHGGWVDIRSELGVGTTVTVYFPERRVVASEFPASSAPSAA